MKRLKICWEVLTIRSGHAHMAQEKELSTFMNGYQAGMEDHTLDDADLQEEGRTEAVEFVGKLAEEWLLRACVSDTAHFTEEATILRECASDLETRISDLANTI